MRSQGSIAHARDVERGDRFEFGKNWARFLAVLDEERIDEACKSLRKMLRVDTLAGRTFLDVGSGSGLFSLAAMRLGAARVVSFDYDPSSVACTRELRRRYFAEASHWLVEPGSALDEDYLGRLGRFDVVYSWGVLHHTGEMWRGLENVHRLVNAGGSLFIAIYRDQGWLSSAWLGVKKAYNRNSVSRGAVIGTFCSFFVVEGVLADVARLRNPFDRYTEYKRQRGMSRVRDWFDWLGGLPFEVASAPQICTFYEARGFELVSSVFPQRGHGCNEFVFRRARELEALDGAA